MSRAGNNTAAGFSLIELLVVMTIMVAATLAIAGAVPEYRRHAAVDAGASQLASLMRKARMAAIAKERTVAISLDPHTRRYWVSGSGVVRTLPNAVTVISTRPEPLLNTRFHPDGSADGLSVLMSDGRKQVRLDVSPVTGRVVVQR